LPALFPPASWQNYAGRYEHCLRGQWKEKTKKAPFNAPLSVW
jgi:hypothetical protein